MTVLVAAAVLAAAFQAVASGWTGSHSGDSGLRGGPSSPLPMPPTYTVEFVETGLGAGMTWTVTINGTSLSGITNCSGAILELSEPNGSYPYTVTPVAGYTASPPSGVTTVSGSNIVIHVTFTPNNGVGEFCSSLSTSLRATSIVVGGSVSDSATLSGTSPYAGGTISFYYSATATCPYSAATPVPPPIAVSGPGTYLSSPVTFPYLGTYYWYAIYSGDANDSAATSACETLMVTNVTFTNSTVTTTLSSPSIPLGSSVQDSATLSGVTTPAGGSIAFYYSTTDACPVASASLASTVSVTGPGTYLSRSLAFFTSGTYYWYAAYSGDSSNNPATSPCETLTVTNSTLTTTLSTSDVAVGGSVRDSASLTGTTPTAGGTISFFFSTTDGCPATGATAVPPPIAVSGPGIYQSSAYTFSMAGTYYWYAVYSGDANNNPATSPCEQLIIETAGAFVTTNLLSSSIPLGSSVQDSATLSGVTTPAGGSIAFYYSTTDACPVASASLASTVSVTGPGTYLSRSLAFFTSGTYYWYAAYSGDSSNNPATSPCETLTVTNSTLTTTLSTSDVAAGGSVRDSASLTGTTPTAGGTISFFFSTTDGCPATGATAVPPSIAVSGPGIYQSSAYTFSMAGTYYWYAVYSGDANNNPATSPCEKLVIQLSGSMLTTTLSNATIVAGGSVQDSATLSGVTTPAGGSISFYYSTSGACPAPAPIPIPPSVAVTGPGVYASGSVTLLTAGTYYFYAVYSGDSSNNPATSACEKLVVTLTNPTITTAFQPAACATTVTPQGGPTFSVTFVETGLPVGTLWSVTLNGVTQYSVTTSITFQEPNGTYCYSVGGGGGYFATPDMGSVTVAGASFTVIVPFTPTVIISGSSISDSATLTGTTNPAGGTISFYYSTTDACPAPGAIAVPPPDAVTGPGLYTSGAVTLSSPGTYYFYATYSGDANNNPATSACEKVTVTKATPLAVTNLTTPMITVGSSVQDLVTLSGLTNPASGSVTFYYSTYDFCPDTAAVPAGTDPVTGPGTYASSVVHFGSAGTYYFYAVYSGDAQNNPATSACEALVVEKTTPTLTTLLSATTITAGSAVHDTATLLGTTNPATGSVSFYYSSTNACPVAGAHLVGSDTVTGPGSYVSTPVTLATPGTYYFYAVYSGDANNQPVTSACEKLTVDALVTFAEVGLPAGTTWSVSVAGQVAVSAVAGSPIIVMVAPGTYSYLAGAATSGWLAVPSGGSVVASVGADISVTIAYREAYPVTASANVPAGTTWFFNVTGTTSPTSATETGTSVTYSFVSTQPTMTFYLPNGTYTYSAQSPATGVAGSPSGTLAVEGAQTAAVALTFGAGPAPPSILSPLVLALASSLGVAVALGAFLVLRRRGRRGSSALPPAEP